MGSPLTDWLFAEYMMNSQINNILSSNGDSSAGYGKYRMLQSGIWNNAASFSLEGGQVLLFKLYNPNALGTTISISAGHDSKQAMIPPMSRVQLEFSRFGKEPSTWNIQVSSISAAFIVAWELWSTWVPGMPSNE